MSFWFNREHKHHKRTQKRLDYVIIQWCRCGDAYRSKATIGSDRGEWQKWRPLAPWMMDEPGLNNT